MDSTTLTIGEWMRTAEDKYLRIKDILTMPNDQKNKILFYELVSS